MKEELRGRTMTTRKQPHPITREDFDKIVDAVKQELESHWKPRKKKYSKKGVRIKQYLVAICLGFGSGMRISEIVGLEKQQSYYYEKKNGAKISRVIYSSIPPLTFDSFDFSSRFIYLGKRKKGKQGRVPIPIKLFRRAGITKEDLSSLLPMDISARSLQMYFTGVCKSVLKKHSTFHQLRHGFVTHALESGMDIHDVQNLAGHSRLETTGKYLHSNPIRARDKYEETF